MSQACTNWDSRLSLFSDKHPDHLKLLQIGLSLVFHAVYIAPPVFRGRAVAVGRPSGGAAGARGRQLAPQPPSALKWILPCHTASEARPVVLNRTAH